MSMTLDDFVKDQIKVITAFSEYWKKKHGTDPNTFPMTMEDGQEGLWWEMLQCYNESESVFGGGQQEPDQT